MFKVKSVKAAKVIDSLSLQILIMLHELKYMIRWYWREIQMMKN